MKKIFIGLGVLLVLLIGAILIIPSLVPSSVYKERIQTQLTKELQRDVTIEGDVKLAVFPVIKAQTGRVIIANPDGFDNTEFASMDALSARVKLLPLLSKRVEISSFTLKNPSINLYKTTDGRANWVIGDADPTPEPETDDPFKRDGRFADLAPSIGQFTLENGAITYRDAQADQTLTLKDANLAFSLPGLDKKVSVKGDVIANDEPIDMTLMLNTPRKFLDGKRAPFDFTLKTDFADIKGNGAFLSSTDIAFTVDLDGNITDFSTLKPYIESDIDIDALVNTASIDGTYNYDGMTLSAEGSDIRIKGDMIDAAYQGDAILSEPPVLNGKVNAKATDIPAILQILNQDVKGANLVKSANLTANLTAEGTGFSAQNIKADVKGADVDATFTGSGAYGDIITAKGDFTAKAGSVPAIINALELDMPQARALGSVDASGTVALEGEDIVLDFVSARTSGDYINASYIGKVSQKGDDLSANGTFDAKVNAITELANIAEVEVPYAAAIGELSAIGSVIMQGEQLDINLTSAKTTGEYINAEYIGQVNQVGETLNLKGTFDASVQKLAELSDVAEVEIPYADAIGVIAANGALSGTTDNLSVTNLVATLSDGQLNGGFTGSARAAEVFALDGKLNADIPSVRTLAETTGTVLPPNTDAGTIFEAFKIDGTVSGNPSEITFTGANVAFDEFAGTGEFTANLSGAKPVLTANLDMNELDIRPYMASYATQNPTGEIQPWSEEPINVEALRAVDGNFVFNTPGIIMDRMTMGETAVTVTLTDGVLVTDVPKVPLYGGLGTLKATLNGQGSTPEVALKLTMDDYNSNTFLAAVAGFTRLTGEGGTLLDVTGQGQSQAEIMKSLNGSGDFSILNGQISGIDLEQFMTGISTAISSKSLPGGIGSSYATKFSDIKGLFTVENGVAKINEFDFSGFGVAAAGSGELDLGNQKIDFSLQPRLTSSSANDLAKFGIPIRFQGNFGSVSPGIDTSMLTKIAAARVKAEAQEQIKNQVGGQAGDILGSIMGGNSTETGTATQSTTPEDTLKNALGGILGTQTQQPANQTDGAKPATSETQSKEPSVEDALSSIFGKKKKDDGE